MPKVVRKDDGYDVWVFNGAEHPQHRPQRRGRAAQGGVRHRADRLRRDAPRLLGRRTSGSRTWMPAACWAPCTSRPSPASAAACSPPAEDKDLALAVVRAYNDWHVDEWCGVLPRAASSPWACRCCGIPSWPPQEVRRLAEKGVHSLTFTENPYTLGYPSFHSDHWDPLWRALCRHRHGAVDPPRLLGPAGLHRPRCADRRDDHPAAHEHRTTRRPTCSGRGSPRSSRTSRSPCPRAAPAGSPTSSTASTAPTTCTTSGPGRTSATSCRATCSASTSSPASSPTRSASSCATRSASTTSRGSATTPTRTRRGRSPPRSWPRWPEGVPRRRPHKMGHENAMRWYSLRSLRPHPEGGGHRRPPCGPRRAATTWPQLVRQGTLRAHVGIEMASRTCRLTDHPAGHGLTRVGHRSVSPDRSVRLAPLSDESRRRVAVLTLADPGRRNSLGLEMTLALAAAVERAVAADVGALVLAAEPPVFCAGGSLDDLLAPRAPLADTYIGMLALAEAPVVTIAAVGGAAIGAGVNLPWCATWWSPPRRPASTPAGSMSASTPGAATSGAWSGASGRQATAALVALRRGPRRARGRAGRAGVALRRLRRGAARRGPTAWPAGPPGRPRAGAADQGDPAGLGRPDPRGGCPRHGAGRPGVVDGPAALPGAPRVPPGGSRSRRPIGAGAPAPPPEGPAVRGQRLSKVMPEASTSQRRR